MGRDLMVKDLISYHIQVEQEALKKQQELVHGLINFLVKETGCPIELDVIDVPYEHQPKNDANDMSKFAGGKLIAGHNFEAYDMRKLRTFKIKQIWRSQIPCEIDSRDAWVVLFDHDRKANFIGDIGQVLAIFGYVSVAGETKEITDHTFCTGRKFFNFDHDKRQVTFFTRSQVLDWIATESGILKFWQKNGRLSTDVNYFYDGKLWSRNALEDNHRFECCKVLSLRCHNDQNKGFSISLKGIDNPRSHSTLEDLLFVASTDVTHFRL